MTDISNDAYLARMAIVEMAMFLSAAHVRMRPRIFPDGDQWCCLYGDDLGVGVAGFGDTPEKACADFDKRWGTLRCGQNNKEPEKELADLEYEEGERDAQEALHGRIEPSP